MKFMDDIEWLKGFAASQQEKADYMQSKAAEYQRSADSARKRVKFLKRELKGEGNVEES